MGDEVGIGVFVIVGGTGVYVGGKDVLVGWMVLVGCSVIVGGKALGGIACCGRAIPDEQLAIRAQRSIIIRCFFTRIDMLTSLPNSFFVTTWPDGIGDVCLGGQPPKPIPPLSAGKAVTFC